MAEICSKHSLLHDQLLFYNKVRWLSAGESVQRMNELYTAIDELLSELSSAKAVELKSEWQKPEFQLKLGFLQDFCLHLNAYSKQMQAININWITVCMTQYLYTTIIFLFDIYTKLIIFFILILFTNRSKN